jgi:hypothetical protein
MFIVWTGVGTNTELGTHLTIDAILILLVKFNNWLEDVSGILINLIDFSVKCMIAISLDVIRASITRCNENAAKYG